MIVCKECDQEKSDSEFHVKTSSSTGLYPYCKDCRRKRGGYSARKLPDIRSADAKADTQDLIEDVFYLAKRFPKNMIYRIASQELSNRPDGPHSNLTADVLFHCWNKRQRHAGTSKELDESRPVLGEDREAKIARIELTNMFGIGH